MPTIDTKPKVMIVDDTPTNLILLDNMLRVKGYRVFAFPLAEMALKAAGTNPPDIFLLDISMPEMDGFQMCERLKRDEKLREIPVIFISALTELTDKVRAFAAGGVDYITKPLQIEEVHARVETHLRICAQKREIEQNYKRLRELESLRDDMVHMIIHDLRAPLTGILGYLQLLKMGANNETDARTIGFLDGALGNASSMIEMVNSLLDVSRLESGALLLDRKPTGLTELTNETISSMGGIIGNRKLTFNPPEEILQINCDSDLIRRVIINLIGNAIKFSPPTGHIEVFIDGDLQNVRFSVSDEGPGIAPEYHTQIFEKFKQVGASRNRIGYSSGLGLTFCKLAVEAHGGSIGLTSQIGKGSTFWFTLPISNICVDILDRTPPATVGNEYVQQTP